MQQGPAKSESTANGVFESGENTLGVQKEMGSTNYSISYQSLTAVDDAEVSVNDRIYEYPEDFAGSGPITDSIRMNISSLNLGENSINTEVLTEDGNVPSLTTKLQYDGARTKSLNPKVMVINSSGGNHSKSLPNSILEDNKLVDEAKISIPQSWFSNGENKIIVKTSDGSYVEAELNATGLEFQSNRFNRTQDAS